MQKIEYISIQKLTAHSQNPRKIDARQMKVLTESITANPDYFEARPILANKELVVFAGNMRLLAARQLGLKEVPVAVMDISAERQRELMIRDNRENGVWDWELLGSTFDMPELLSWGFEEKDLLGFEDFAPAQNEDDIPEIPPEAPTITKKGDVWLLGEHRVMCGDSTDKASVERLMDGKKAVACITDPPYSVNYDRSQEERGGNKDVHSAYHEADLDPMKLLNGFLELVDCPLLVFSYPVDRHFFDLSDALKSNGFTLRKELVWVKDTFSFWMGAKYQQRHEPILVCSKDGLLHANNVPSNQSTVFEIPRPKKHELHPTLKPIELWEKLVMFHTDSGELVYEPFCGGGTTIIAAEKTGRICYGMELDPRYCDVILKRWEDFTGQKAIKS